MCRYGAHIELCITPVAYNAQAWTGQSGEYPRVSVDVPAIAWYTRVNESVDSSHFTKFIYICILG